MCMGGVFVYIHTAYVLNDRFLFQGFNFLFYFEFKQIVSSCFSKEVFFVIELLKLSSLYVFPPVGRSISE